MKKGEKKEDMKNVAKNMFETAEKEGYYLGNMVIRNLTELVENLEKFTENEAHWVASWIEYLGDPMCAKKIQKNPGKFKDIIKDRNKELQKHR